MLERLKMALVLLNPGLRPLGQFDFADGDASKATGGEIAKIVTYSSATEAAAADVSDNRDLVHFQLDSFSDGRLCGLVDEGQSPSEDNTPGYGTLLGQAVGVNATMVDGSIKVGPSTVYGTGKATIWHQAGLYGVTEEAFISGQPAAAVAAGINTSLFGTATGGSTAGKLTTVSTGNEAAWWISREAGTSLVSTTNSAAGAAIATEYHIIYFPGPTK